MFEHIGGFLGSILSGGLTGIIGVGVQRFADYKNQQLKIQGDREKMAHEIELRKIDHQIMIQESENGLKLAELHAASAEELAESQVQVASYSLEPKQFSPSGQSLTRGQSWAFILLDCVRGLIRPSLTLYLAGLSTLIYFQSANLIRTAGFTINPEQAYDLVEQATQTVLYLFATCTMWWFGSRNKASEAMARKK